MSGEGKEVEQCCGLVVVAPAATQSSGGSDYLRKMRDIGSFMYENE